MRVRLLKKENNLYLQLPNEFASLSEVEISQLKGQYWLLSPPIPENKTTIQNQPLKNPQAVQSKKPELSEAEDKILKKLLSIKFEQRTPTRIERTFSKFEKDVLRQLIKKGHIQVFYGK
ncbi:hypothetical protein KJ780_01285, partial [Candidatus Micrarchaeota archaeon]|nr:hypothetical protein [Candidatus Micrarchaeota archaeon]